MNFNIIQRFKSMAFLKGQKGKNLIVVVGLAGILLILLSDLSACEKKESISESKATQSSSEDYKKQLETQLCGLIGSIDGVGKTKVMITLSGSSEYVYVNQEKKSVDTSNDTGYNKSSESIETSTSPVIISDSDGEQALIRLEKTPKVMGVVVVCEGGDDPVVRQRVTGAVTTALDISSQRVCITLLSEN